MPKLVCPHSGIFAVIKKQPSSELEMEDVEVVDLTGEEDEESVDDEDEVDHDLVASQNVQIAMAKAHSGRVKALAKMYDKFAEKLQKAQEQAPRKVRSNVGVTLVQDVKEEAEPSSSSSSSKVKCVRDADAVAGIQEKRLEVLEEKVDALVTFVKGLLTHNLETLGKGYTQDVINEKEGSVVKAKIRAFDDELDEVQANYEDVHTMVQNAKTEMSKIKTTVNQWSKFTTKELQGLKQNLRLISKTESDNLEAMKGIMARLDLFLVSKGEENLRKAAGDHDYNDNDKP